MMCIAYKSDNSFIFSKLFPFDCFRRILCPLHNLNTLWYIVMILHIYVEQVMMMCDTRMTTLAFIVSELFPLDYFICSFLSAP